MNSFYPVNLFVVGLLRNFEHNLSKKKGEDQQKYVWMIRKNSNKRFLKESYYLT